MNVVKKDPQAAMIRAIREQTISDLKAILSAPVIISEDHMQHLISAFNKGKTNEIREEFRAILKDNEQRIIDRILAYTDEELLENEFFKERVAKALELTVELETEE